MWSEEESFGFTSISDAGNHGAAAIHAALRPIIASCVERGITKLTMVSDSPTSQYRNCKNVYLCQQLAKEQNLEIEWIYTEAGHGKVAV